MSCFVTPYTSPSQANGVVPDQPNSAVRARNSNKATLRTMFNRINRIETTISAQATASVVGGLVRVNGPFPTCSAWYGSRVARMDIVNQNAPGSSLKVNCPQASTLRLTNYNGRCMHVGIPNARRIQAAGNRTISIIMPPRSLPSVVNVAGMTHWGPPGRSDLNTRLLIRLSQLQAHGDAMRHGSLTVEGKLQYAVPYGAAGVVVKGCGAVRKVACEVQDAMGRPVCRLVEKCTTDPVLARQTMMMQLFTMPPCTNPP